MEHILKDTEKFVINLLNTKLDSHFVYHNIAHTQRVVKKAKELAELHKLSDKDITVLTIASWFHDTGYTENIDMHEEKSVEIASEFLSQQEGVSKEDIALIGDLIMATKLKNSPNSLSERIIRDADCSHIGSKNYSDFTELLRKEWELTNRKTYNDKEWLDENIDFLTGNHEFHTNEAANLWDDTKSKNLAALLKKVSKLDQEETKLKQKKTELEFKKNKMELPERGIETMFRVTLKNHITLSDIADTKANILLSVNAIIVSLVLSNLVSKLDNPSNSYLIIPTVIFTLFTVSSMILSVLATRPNVTEGKFTKEDVNAKKVNLLFFGNFHQMSLPDFEWAMSEMMKDRDYLYSSMKKDLYFLGLVLNRKYKLLRLTYTVFMIGIIVSVIAFAASFKMQEPSSKNNTENNTAFEVIKIQDVKKKVEANTFYI